MKYFFILFRKLLENANTLSRNPRFIPWNWIQTERRICVRMREEVKRRGCGRERSRLLVYGIVRQSSLICQLQTFGGSVARWWNESYWVETPNSITRTSNSSFCPGQNMKLKMPQQVALARKVPSVFVLIPFSKCVLWVAKEHNPFSKFTKILVNENSQIE